MKKGKKLTSASASALRAASSRARLSASARSASARCFAAFSAAAALILAASSVFVCWVQKKRGKVGFEREGVSFVFPLRFCRPPSEKKKKM